MPRKVRSTAQKLVDALEFMRSISKRCPQCQGYEISSDNSGNHRCLECGWKGRLDAAMKEGNDNNDTNKPTERSI